MGFETAMNNALQSRYGTAGKAPAASQRRGFIALAAVVAILFAGAAFLAFQPRGNPHTPQTISFTAHNAARATLTYSVVPDRERDIRCSAIAKNPYEAVVGFAEVTVPASPEASGNTTVQGTVDIRTTQLAVQGLLESCTFMG